MSFITFVIPTIGRQTLRRTLDSLKKQTIADWNAIVVFDGIEPNITYFDDRVSIVKIEKAGKIQKHKKFGEISTAGLVRNEAFKFVKSKWIGFVDDDDIVYSNYFEFLQDDDEENDIILFRMNSDRIIPPLDRQKIRLNEVGISFAVRTEQVKKYDLKFKNCGSEDYEFFKDAIDKGLRYKISKHVTYEVCLHHTDKGEKQ